MTQPNSRSPGTRADDLGMIAQIRDVSRAIVREWGFMGGDFAGTDLSPSTVHALIEIDKGEVTARELGTRLRLEKSSVSRLLRKLVDSGDVLETPSTDDARSKMLSLSPQGRRQVEAVHDFANAQVAGALKRLLPGQDRTVLDGLRLYTRALQGAETVKLPVDIAQGYRPGIIASVTQMHAHYYAREAGLGQRFESLVASGLADLCDRLDRPQNAIWAALRGDEIVGSISMDGDTMRKASPTCASSSLETMRAALVPGGRCSRPRSTLPMIGDSQKLTFRPSRVCLRRAISTKASGLSASRSAPDSSGARRLWSSALSARHPGTSVKRVPSVTMALLSSELLLVQPAPSRKPMPHPLDNPIWTALSTKQSAQAQVIEGVRRYDPAFAPFAASSDGSQESYARLAELVPEGGQVVLQQAEIVAPPPGLIQIRCISTVQMVARRIVGPGIDIDIETLGPADAPDMLALAALTKPGPFAERTPSWGASLACAIRAV
jgi:DNA-binding MarR family transcriptional regulator